MGRSLTDGPCLDAGECRLCLDDPFKARTCRGQRYPRASRYFAPASKTLGPGRKNPKASASRPIVLNEKQTASASSIWSRETPAASTARMSSAFTACSRVSLQSMRSVAGRGSSIVALKIGEHCGNPRSIAICTFGDGGVRLRAPVALISLGDERGHELVVGNRPRGGPAHRELVAE